MKWTLTGVCLMQRFILYLRMSAWSILRYKKLRLLIRAENMDALEQALLTVLAGILVFVIGQITIKFIVEPVHDLYKLYGEITHAVIYYDNVTPMIANSYRKQLEAAGLNDETREQLKSAIDREWKWLDEAKHIYRTQASELLARTTAVRLYWLWRTLGLLPKYANVLQASSELFRVTKVA
jgi:hypothetical protein